VTRSSRKHARAAMAVANVGLVLALVALGVLTVRGGEGEPGLVVARDAATRLEIPAVAGPGAGLDPRMWTALKHAAEDPRPVVEVPPPAPPAPPAPAVSVLLAGVDTEEAGAGSCILAVGGVQLALAQGDRLPDGRALVNVEIEGEGDGRAARVTLEGPGGERSTFELSRVAR
jgi:hypothetical protein